MRMRAANLGHFRRLVEYIDRKRKFVAFVNCILMHAINICDAPVVVALRPTGCL